MYTVLFSNAYFRRTNHFRLSRSLPTLLTTNCPWRIPPAASLFTRRDMAYSYRYYTYGLDQCSVHYYTYSSELTDLQCACLKRISLCADCYRLYDQWENECLALHPYEIEQYQPVLIGLYTEFSRLNSPASTMVYTCAHRLAAYLFSGWF